MSVGQRGGKGPTYAASFIAVDKRIVRHHLGPLEIQAKRHLPEPYPCDGLAHSSLALLFTEQQQKPAAAGPGDLAPESPVPPRHNEALITQRNRNITRNVLFA